ncbi:hypothetical protein XK09_06890 [Campylobacter lanienae]|uniref:Uncharacterized protein n=1 Tax=Campylobacter lanienae TaxID=75658 RepID=A0ABY3G613_9BACT|nr:hypothetical protein [Campylobacter lanienae]TWO27753.1 hypothetical protein XK09_06890 [Campylobacter lanienae]
MALFSHEDKQAIYELSDMATELRKDFFKIFGKIKIFWVISPIAVTILLSFVFGKGVFVMPLAVLIIGMPILFIVKFILYYKISKIQKQDKYDNDELLWYEFLNQLVSFFLWFLLFLYISGLFAELAGLKL